MDIEHGHEKYLSCFFFCCLPYFPNINQCAVKITWLNLCCLAVGVREA